MVITFPKIFTLGQPPTARLFNGPVEITEKIDGSQFNFGWLGDKFVMHSKGQEIFAESVDKMFAPAVAFALSCRDKLTPDTILHGEYLARPKHNVLAYQRVPKAHFALFAVSNGNGTFNGNRGDLEVYANVVGCDVAPILHAGAIDASDGVPVKFFMEMLERESVLGGPKVEGIVIKNYAESVLLGGFTVPVLSAKFVSEAFKEKHKKEWAAEAGASKLEMLLLQYRSPARWRKAVEHLRDAGRLEQSPRDIGNLIVEVRRDLAEEEREAVKDELWKLYEADLMRRAVQGLPEWYKAHLVESLMPETDAHQPPSNAAA